MKIDSREMKIDSFKFIVEEFDVFIHFLDLRQIPKNKYNSKEMKIDSFTQYFEDGKHFNSTQNENTTQQ